MIILPIATTIVLSVVCVLWILIGLSMQGASAATKALMTFFVLSQILAIVMMWLFYSM